MKNLIAKIDDLLLRHYKTILFIYLLVIIEFFWWQLLITSGYPYNSYELLQWSADGGLWVGEDLQLLLLVFLPLVGLMAWKKIFHPKD